MVKIIRASVNRRLDFQKHRPFAVLSQREECQGGGLSLLADLTRRHRAVPTGRESRVFESLWRSIRHTNPSHDAVIRVYDETGNVIETHQHKGDFKEW
jgi:hypothetical protein